MSKKIKLKPIELIIDENLNKIEIDPLKVIDIKITDNYINIYFSNKKITLVRDKIYYIHWRSNIRKLQSYYEM